MKKTTNAYRLVDGIAIVDVSTGKYPLVFTLIDCCDVERVVSGRRWCAAQPNPRYGIRVARRTQDSRSTEWLHRFILSVDDSRVWVDHRDGDALNNRRDNLRPCSPFQNQGNRRRNRTSSSPYKGITWDGRRWAAQIHAGGVHAHLGRFEAAEDAARAYDKAALEAFGEFALTNFPVAA